jgi:hypothetical protein
MMSHPSRQSADDGGPGAKKPYGSPRLDAYGDLQEITGLTTDPMGMQDGVDPHKKSSTTVG